jgi:hypothetical protein
VGPLLCHYLSTAGRVAPSRLAAVVCCLGACMCVPLGRWYRRDPPPSVAELRRLLHNLRVELATCGVHVGASAHHSHPPQAMPASSASTVTAMASRIIDKAGIGGGDGGLGDGEGGGG